MVYPVQPPEPDLPSPERDTTNPLFAARVTIKYMDPWSDQNGTRFFFGDSIARVWVPNVVDADDGEYKGLLLGTLSPSTLTSRWIADGTDDDFGISVSTVSSWTATVNSISCTDNGSTLTFTVVTNSAAQGYTAVVVPFAEAFPVVSNLTAYQALGDFDTVNGSNQASLTVNKNPMICQYAVVVCSGSSGNWTPISLPKLYTL